MTAGERSELLEFRAEFNKRMDRQDLKLDALDSRVQSVEIAKAVAEKIIEREQLMDKHALTQRQIRWGGVGIAIALVTALVNFVIAHGAAIAALAILL